MILSSGIDFDQMIGFKAEYIPGEFISSLLVILIVIILAIVINILVRKADPLSRPKGLLFLAELAVEKCDNLVKETMGSRFPKFGAYVLCLAVYMGMSFLIGLLGLPNPFTYYGIPLSLALITFIMIHATAVKYNHWSYFKRYVEPVFVFLPINLVSMWSPLISMSFRLFGNAVAGFAIMQLFYQCMAVIQDMELVFSYAFVITPFAHMYFDLFSGGVQTLIFMLLTMILVSQEAPEDDVIAGQLA